MVPPLFYQYKKQKTSLSRPRRHEGDRSRFSVMKLPVALQSYLVEKMMYTDFANFNNCSNLSLTMCNALPKTVALPYFLDSVEFTHYSVPTDPEELERRLPKNLHYFCNSIDIDPKIWELVKHYQLTVENLRMFVPVSPQLLKEVLKVTKASEAALWRLEHESLKLSEIKQLKGFSFKMDDITEKELLTLSMPNLDIRGSNFSTSSLIKLLSQWISGERKISKLVFGVEPDLQLNELYEELIKEKNISIQTYGEEEYWICKSDDDKNCIKISISAAHFFAEGGEMCQMVEAD